MTRSSLPKDELRDWLRLARTESVGAVTFAHLIGRYGRPAEALKALPELARRGGRAQAPRTPNIAEVTAEIDAGESLGARLLASCDPDFPTGLAVLDPPPPVLWVLGDIALLGRPMVAVVGARIASAGGRKIARDLAAGLGDAGWVVVSGMARGIDTAAHEGAMQSGTVAVLAGGVDDIYPPENAALHDQLRVRGCIVSERAIGSGVKAADFPRRNRIISGLSRGVVVVEAELRSGSLITARLAAEQGREVFAVPGSPLDPRSRGANDLLRQGATLAEEAVDVLRVLETLPGFSEDPPRYAQAVSNAETSVDAVERYIDIVAALLSHAPTPLNTLAREADVTVAVVMAALTELALAGRAELLPGNLAVAL